MAGTGSITITGKVSNTQAGSRDIGTLTISSAPATEQTLATVTTVILQSGANTITVPSTTAVGCVIVFAAASTVTKTLKGVTGDTGIIVSKVNPCVLTFDTSAIANFVITAGGVDTGNITELWWI